MAKDYDFLDGFQEDHRQLGKCSKSLQRAIKDSEVNKAKNILDKMEKLIITHFKFEENYLYPRLERLTREIIQKLFSEHATLLEGIKETKNIFNKDRLNRLERANALTNLSRLSTTLNRCGELAFFAQKFDKDEKNDLNRRFKEYKAQRNV